MLRARPVARGLERHEDALGAAGGDGAVCFGPGAEQIRGPGDDFIFELAQAWKCGQAQPVLGEEAQVRFLGDGEHIVARIVHEQGDAPAAPVDIIAPCALHLGEH